MIMDDISAPWNAASPIVHRELSSSNDIDTNESQDLKAYVSIRKTLLGMIMDDIPVPSNAPSPMVSRELSSSNDIDAKE